MQKYAQLSRYLFFVALAFIVYMPLHVFIAQSASLVTGGIEVWKAAKDILLISLVPLLLYVTYKNKVFRHSAYRWYLLIGSLYVLIHLLFVLFDTNDDTGSAIVASVYNSRLLGFMLLGLAVGSLKEGEKYLKWLLTATVLVASAVALFGVAQYFLPSDLLTHVGYSLDRGVKPLFFIDDKPDLPRIMSTLKDPNSLGAYLIVPILLTGYALVSKQINEKLFARPFRRGTLAAMLCIQIAALVLTFSRGALLGLGLSTVTILYIVTGQSLMRYVRKFWIFIAVGLVCIAALDYLARDTYLVQNVIFHADESTVLEDPNELRVTLTQQAVDEVIDEPLGHGPGTAGLVSIRNPKGGILTENYYLQIAYEVGWLGITLFVTILGIVTVALISFSKKGDAAARVLLAALVGYLFYSLLIHLWSNEAIALQWWLLLGVVCAVEMRNSRLKH